jgi:hypothetical protein
MSCWKVELVKTKYKTTMNTAQPATSHTSQRSQRRFFDGITVTGIESVIN